MHLHLHLRLQLLRGIKLWLRGGGQWIHYRNQMAAMAGFPLGVMDLILVYMRYTSNLQVVLGCRTALMFDRVRDVPSTYVHSKRNVPALWRTT